MRAGPTRDEPEGPETPGARQPQSVMVISPFCRARRRQLDPPGQAWRNRRARSYDRSRDYRRRRRCRNRQRSALSKFDPCADGFPAKFQTLRRGPQPRPCASCCKSCSRPPVGNKLAILNLEILLEGRLEHIGRDGNAVAHEIRSSERVVRTRLSARSVRRKSALSFSAICASYVLLISALTLSTSPASISFF
jgi:hypothetical protein